MVSIGIQRYLGQCPFLLVIFAQVAGVHPRQVTTHPDGTLDFLELESKIRKRGNYHEPISRLICLEQTHNTTGGRVLSLQYMKKVKLVNNWLVRWTLDMKVGGSTPSPCHRVVS